MKSLCIITPRVHKVSETFIRDHIRCIAPGDTCVVSLKEDENPPVAEPTLALMDRFYQPRSALRSKWDSLVSLLRSGYTIDLSNDSRQKLHAFLVEMKPRAVLAEYGSTGMIAADTVCRLGIPLYVHFHGWDAAIGPGESLKRRQYIRLGRQAAGFIFPSRYLASRLAGSIIPAEKCHVAPCAVDLERWKPSTLFDPNLIVAVGRFVPKKAPLLALRAFAEVVRQYPTARLEMIGDGPLWDAAKALVAELNLTEAVTLHGPKSHDFVHQRLTQAAAFLQHSVTAEDGNLEGLPVSILEALAAGVPVVSTLHSGIPEAVSDGENGFLVPENDVSGTARSLLAVLTSPDLRVRLSHQARRTAEATFGRETQVAQLRSILKL